MKIKKLSEDFTPSTIMAVTNRKAPAETRLDLALSGALAEEEIFTAQADSVFKEIEKNNDGAEAKTADDKKAVGKSRDYDRENPHRIADNEYTNPEKYEDSKKITESARLFMKEDVDNFYSTKRGACRPERRVVENTIKRGNHWENRGEKGSHGKFKTKEEAAKQRRAMFANGFKESRLTEAPIYDLTPQFGSRQSFYGKAKVFEKRDGTKTLYSYDTPVCTITAGGQAILYPAWDYSATTLRHVKDFLKQHGFTAVSKSQIERDYPVSKETPVLENKRISEKYVKIKKSSPEHYRGSGLMYDVINAKGNDDVQDGDTIIEIPDEFINQFMEDSIGMTRDAVASRLSRFLDRGEEDYDSKLEALTVWFMDYAETHKMINGKSKKYSEYVGSNDLFNVVYDRLFGGVDDKFSPKGIASGKSVVLSPKDGFQIPRWIRVPERTLVYYPDDLYVGNIFNASGDYPGKIQIRIPTFKEMEFGFSSTKKRDELNKIQDTISSRRIKYPSYDANAPFPVDKEKFFDLMKQVAEELDLDFEINGSTGVIDFYGDQGMDILDYIQDHPDINQNLLNKDLLRPGGREHADRVAASRAKKSERKV